MAGDELQLVKWLESTAKGGERGVTIGIGDDMAALSMAGSTVLVSCDILLDGVHFDTSRHSPAEIGRKALACSLSDCAAMAVRPAGFTVSLALPPATDTEAAQALLTGMMNLAEPFGTALLGGDTTRWGGKLVIDVTVLGEPYPGCEPVRRSGARQGDLLYVTGQIGGSLLGRHLRFTPRVREARVLAETLGSRLHAMIDLSDGLSLDLWRICQASNTGALIDEELLAACIHPDAVLSSEADQRSPMDHALSDGEDFELLLAVDSRIESPPVPLWPIGEIVGSGLMMRSADGRTAALEPRGFIH